MFLRFFERGAQVFRQLYHDSLRFLNSEMEINLFKSKNNELIGYK